MSRLIVAPLLASLAACGHMPVSTLWALRSFDAANVDSKTLRAAIRMPEALEPRPGGVTLTVGWWRDGEENNRHEAKFALLETTAPEDIAPLTGEKTAGTRLYAYRVDPADHARIRALQQRSLEEKARNPGATHGSFGVGADSCRRGELPDGPLLTTSYLRTRSSGDYLTLLKDVDLRTAVTTEKPLAALLPPCEKFALRATPSIPAN
ncbi:hypothetical protein IY145_24325 [Methylosinus sp. H3A]|nr:hypothetical protein [Methylosinus sp. H3A]